jgi:hypothetical protein
MGSLELVRTRYEWLINNLKVKGLAKTLIEAIGNNRFSTEQREILMIAQERRNGKYNMAESRDMETKRNEARICEGKVPLCLKEGGAKH